MSAFRSLLHAITSHPQRLLSSFVILLLLAGSLIMIVAGQGFHHIVDDTTAAQHRALAHAAIHNLIQRPAFQYSDREGAGLAMPPEHDTPQFREEAAQYLAAFSVFALELYDRNLDPVLTLNRSETVQLRDDAQLREVRDSRAAFASHPIHADIRTIDNDQALIDREVTIVRSPLHDADTVIGYAAVGIDTTLTHASNHTAVTHAYGTIAVALGLAFAILVMPMYLGVQALILEHRELTVTNARLHELASIDTLTKIYNRRTLTEQVQLEFERLRRNTYHRSSLCVLMADIDHFKRINDTFGHPFGDRVLVEVAARLKDAVRGYDVVGRYGGEEFLVMLPNTNTEGARIVGERILRKVSELPIMADDHRLANVTVSIGISVVDNANTTEATAISVADTALYEAKHQGRNRVVITEIHQPETIAA